jgi:hypothetical protein
MESSKTETQKFINNSVSDELNRVFRAYLSEEPDETYCTENEDIYAELIDKSYQDPVTNRLVMPCIWDQNLVNSITRNFSLSKCILFSNLKKLQKSTLKLKLYDDVIQEQLASGVIEEVSSDDPLLKNDETTFLSHTGVFTEKNGKVKCRVVYLSNLKE